MKKSLIIISAIVLFSLFKTTNVYADIVFPAIANQFVMTFIVGVYWSIALAALILIVETFFIKKLLSINFRLAFNYSFVINLISSIAGVLIASFSVHGDNAFAYGKNTMLGTYVGLIPGYILTVLIEGWLLILAVLFLKRKIKALDCFKTSTLMNLCSYLILLASIFIADVMSKGQFFIRR